MVPSCTHCSSESISPHRSLSFYPRASSCHWVRYLWEPFQSSWHLVKHKPGSVRVLTTWGATWPLRTGAFMSPGVVHYIWLLSGLQWDWIPVARSCGELNEIQDTSDWPSLLIQLFPVPHSYSLEWLIKINYLHQNIVSASGLGGT